MAAKSEDEIFVEELCRRMAMTTGPSSHLNLVSLVASGLMMWGPQNKARMNFDEASVEAAGLVLKAVTELMIGIAELTLDGNAPPN